MATSDSTSKSAPCSVYVIQAQSGAVKIGIAQNVNSRLRELQTGNHEHLKVFYRLEVASREIAQAVEAVLHNRYAQHSLRGEWFTVDTDRLLDDIQFVVTFARLVKSMTVETADVRQEYKPQKPVKRTKRPRQPRQRTSSEIASEATRYFQEKRRATFAELMDALHVDEETAEWLLKNFLRLKMIKPSDEAPDVFEHFHTLEELMGTSDELYLYPIGYDPEQDAAEDEPPVNETASDDEIYEQCVELVCRVGKASISLLQRRMRIGYLKAARLIDRMEADGIVGPETGNSTPRAILRDWRQLP